jgi:NTP pyrophosphatase (non-canonical NTP hydrolase)
MISDELKNQLIDFRKRRDWEKFHKPKDLAVSIVLEAAELLENFQWKNDEEVARMLKGKSFERISEEIADIAIYLTYLCHDLGVDIEDAVSKKLAKNREKYPADKVRGSAKKYNEY